MPRDRILEPSVVDFSTVANDVKLPPPLFSLLPPWLCHCFAPRRAALTPRLDGLEALGRPIFSFTFLLLALQQEKS